MRFFRGISVPAKVSQQTVDEISTYGLVAHSPKARWKAQHEILTEIHELRSKPDLSTNDTRDEANEIDAIYACGDEDGALYYANSHNKSLENNTPIIIEFEAPPSSVIIDGRDFLYSIFRGGSSSHAG